jgi:hypothetical protein
MIDGQPWYVYLLNDGPHWIEYVAAWSTVAASVVAALSAVAIFLQIRQTRRSVEATERALKVAQDEQRLNQATVLDAQRAAIDAQMPRLTVDVESTRDVYNPADIRESTYGGGPYPANYVPDHTFHVSTQAEDRIVSHFLVALANDGPRRARVVLEVMGDEPNRIEGVYDAGSHKDSTHFAVSITRTVEGWRRMAADGPATVAVFTYTFPGEVGAIERHTVIQTGALLTEPDENGNMAFSFELQTYVRPFVRTYYGSISEGRELVAEAPLEEAVRAARSIYRGVFRQRSR